MKWKKMMGYMHYNQPSLDNQFWQFNEALMIIVWIALIAFLIAATRLLWKKGRKV